MFIDGRALVVLLDRKTRLLQNRREHILYLSLRSYNMTYEVTGIKIQSLFSISGKGIHVIA